MTNERLAQRRVLVVEDEYYLMVELCENLRAAEAIVVGPAPSVDRALALIVDEPRIDVAVLDMNLGGIIAYPVADKLTACRIPFVFTTGYEDGALASRYPGVPRCEKPTEFRMVARALADVLQA